MAKSSLLTILSLAGLAAISACSALGTRSNALVLTANGIGPLGLYPDAVISVESLTKQFPEYRITHDVRSGDSPDYHRFEIAGADGEVLFTIASFLKEGQEPTITRDADTVRIDLLKIVSRRIPDSFGIRVGDRVADIIRARGENLTFGAAHFDVYLGGDQLFYNLRTGSDWSPEQFSFADAKRENWGIISMSWPTGAWE
jgi:hypothetical protein